MNQYRLPLYLTNDECYAAGFMPESTIGEKKAGEAVEYLRMLDGRLRSEADALSEGGGTQLAIEWRRDHIGAIQFMLNRALEHDQSLKQAS